jgi:uncharacterized protein YegL
VLTKWIKINLLSCASDPCFETPTDVIFILDHSDSVTEEDFKSIKAFVGRIANEVATSSFSVRIGIITFHSDVSNTIPLTAFEGTLMQNLDNAINILPLGSGPSDMVPALRKMLEIFSEE